MQLKDKSLLGEILTHIKLDGVGPVDNSPSTLLLNHFVKKNLNSGIKNRVEKPITFLEANNALLCCFVTLKNIAILAAKLGVAPKTCLQKVRF